MAEPEYLTITELTPKVSKRLSSKIVVDPITDCWIWIAYRNKNGYGTVYFEKHTELAHRVMFAWLCGPIRRGHDISEPDHTCRNRACVNPFHLELVPSIVNNHRGNSPAAVNKRKTHCIRGHLLPVEPNADHGRRRRCFICVKETQQDFQRDYQRRYRTTEQYREWKRAYMARKRAHINEYARKWRAAKRATQAR